MMAGSEEVFDLETMTPEEMRNLIRNLQAHQLEVERQNEAWLLAAEDSRVEDKRFNIFLENSYDIHFTLNVDGCFVFAAPSWERHFGYPVNIVLGENFLSFVHPDDVELHMEYLREALDGAYSRISPPYRIRHADGVWYWFETNGMPFVDANGSLMFTGTARDITERKQSEAIMASRLRLLEYAATHSLAELLRATLDEAELLTGSRVGFFHFLAADQGTISLQACSTNTTQHICATEISDTYYPVDQAGIWADCIRNRHAVIYNNYAAIVHRRGLPPGHASLIRELVVPVMRGDMVMALLGVGNKPDEYNERDVETVTSLADVAWDIAENKWKEEHLRESNARFDQLAEQSRTIAWEVDSIGMYTYVSRVAETVLGYTPDEMVGRMYFYDLFPEGERETLMAAAFEVFKNRSMFQNFENTALAKGGRQVCLSTNGYPFLNPDGTLAGYRGSDTDITDQRKLKDQLLQSQKMEAVGQLAGGLAHDFNNVLSIINGFCCLLKMDLEQNEQLKEYVERILAASNRAGELTHSMLAFSRTQVMNPQNQNLNMIVSNVGSFIKRIIGEHIQFRSIINDASLVVHVDAGQIEQLLINLATNARDAMPGGGELTISTDLLHMNDLFISAHGFGKSGSYAVITVSDSGSGMDEETKRKIFEPFFTTKSVDKGTGLGLAMVYGITRQHNGYIEVESEPGMGTSFSIYLPIVSSGDIAPAVNIAVSLETWSGNETILVAEDDGDLRVFLSKMLVKLGYRILLATDGQEAVDVFKENAGTIKLIIMDLVMPHKSGKQACDEIRLIKPDVRVLFSSGYSSYSDPQLMAFGEATGFLPKPVRPDQLLEKIRQMLDR